MANHTTGSGLLRRLICLFGALALLACSLARESYGWVSLTQSATNTFVLQEADGVVRLIKYEQGTEIRLANAVYDLYRADGTRLPGRYTTNADGEIRIGQLAPGEYFFREVSTPYGYDFATAENALPFTVTAETAGEVQLTAENVRRLASLTISKQVSGSLSDPDRGFAFRVRIGSDPQATFLWQLYDAAGNPAGSPRTLQNGGEITLSAGQSAEIADLPVGTAYAVTETAGEGYAVQSTGASGTILQQGSRAVFVNTELPPAVPRTGTLTITKQVLPATPETATAETATPETSAPEYFTFRVEIGTDPAAEYSYTIDGGEPQTLRSGGTLTLQDGQSAVFAELPAGTWYQVTEDFPAEYAVTATGSTGTVTPEGVQALFVNSSRRPDPVPAGLSIRKELSAGAADDGTRFAFRVEIGTDPAAEYSYTIDGGEPQTLHSGDTLTLSPGQTAVFAGLTAGTPYTVTELSPDGYQVASENATGTLAEGGTLARFVNTPPATAETATLTVEKTVTGTSAAPAQRFAMTVVLGEDPAREYTYIMYNADGVPEDSPRTLHSGDTITLAHGEKAVFSGLPVGLSYAVEEQDLFADGYLTLTTGSAGTIPAEGTTARFENRYVGAQPDPETIRLSGTKQWDHGELPESSRPDQVTLYALLGQVIVAQQTVTADQDWQYSFDLPRYLADGSQAVYTITEQPVAGYEAEYAPPVTDADGNVTQDITNHAVSGAACYTLTLTKQIAGDTPATPETFTFTLTPDDPANPMPADTQNGSASVQITGAGQASFDSLCFAAEGSYGYSIRELSGGAAGYRYDLAVYHLTVEARLQEGRIHLTASLTGADGQPCDQVRFVNTYTAETTPSTPTPTPGATPAPQAGQSTPAPTATAAPAMQVPQTGDSFPLWQTAALAGISLAALAALWLLRRRSGHLR